MIDFGGSAGTCQIPRRPNAPREKKWSRDHASVIQLYLCVSIDVCVCLRVGGGLHVNAGLATHTIWHI